VGKRTALKLVILLGVVSLFADMTYEGARSITGQYLAILGATGLVVGAVAGFGELIGYGARLFFGHVSDKIGKYWLLTYIGYLVNLVAVPLLALAGNWPLAAALMILERLGKAVRTPSKDAILSYATKEMGRGWGFGLHEAMDQIGAVTGPLIVSAVLYYQGSYQTSFLVLLIPAICALAILAVAWLLYPRPQELEVESQRLTAAGFSRKYWLYIIAVCCVGAGYVDFSLIAYHFEKQGVISNAWIPALFSIAMAADGIAALVFGRLYDIKGISVLILVTAAASFFAPLVFIDGFYFALFGLILWGIGLGSQESIMRAVVGNLVQMDKRGTGYGTLSGWFGISWFLGSVLMGLFYDISIVILVVFSMGVQLASIPFFVAVRKAN
jgi:MFS family permease